MRCARASVAFILAVTAACQDRAKADYDRCMERQRAYDVPAAASACAAAVAADPHSVSGQAAAKELDNMKPVLDRLQAEKAEKAQREEDLKKPPPPLVSAVVSAAPPPTPLEQANELYGSGDVAGARAILDHRVMGATKAAPADPAEVAALRTICKAQKDKACLVALAKKYH